MFPSCETQLWSNYDVSESLGGFQLRQRRVVLGQTSGRLELPLLAKLVIGVIIGAYAVPYVSTSAPFRKANGNGKLKRQKVNGWPWSTIKVSSDDITHTPPATLSARDIHNDKEIGDKTGHDGFVGSHVYMGLCRMQFRPKCHFSPALDQVVAS